MTRKRTKYGFTRDRIKIFRQKMSRLRLVQDVITWLMAAYIRLVFYTSRKKILCHPTAEPYLNGEKNAIFAFWHGRLLMVSPFRPEGRKMHVLISHHNDGELIARTLECFDINTVRGSTSNGGSAAGRNVIRLIAEGGNISITPDGPRGPARKAKAGIINLARISGAPIIPTAISTRRHKKLKSWDRLQIAYPFNLMVASLGEIIHAPREDGEETTEIARKALEDALNTACEQADKALESC